MGVVVQKQMEDGPTCPRFVEKINPFVGTV